jgi:DeoR family transcriptional regulator, glycerol-3-phosphate regulon repressor
MSKTYFRIPQFRKADRPTGGRTRALHRSGRHAAILKALVNHRDLLVVTNSADIARTLATRDGNRVYMAGGELRADDGAALGPTAIDFVAQFHVRTAILSTGAIDVDRGLMDYDLAEAAFSRVVVSRAERTIVVAGHSEFGRRGLVGVCPPESADLLITDRRPPADLAERFAAAEVGIRFP